MTGPCLSTADPCASFAAPLCDDDSDCDSAACLLNPGGYWACAAHATTRPGPWRLVGPVACESGGEWTCEGQWEVMRRRYNALLLEQHKGDIAMVDGVPAGVRFISHEGSRDLPTLPPWADDLGGWWPRG